MTKHIRDALRMAGLRQSEVVITRDGKHPHITVNGKSVTTSCTPRNPDIATRMLARDLRAALNS